MEIETTVIVWVLRFGWCRSHLSVPPSSIADIARCTLGLITTRFCPSWKTSAVRLAIRVLLGPGGVEARAGRRFQLASMCAAGVPGITRNPSLFSQNDGAFESAFTKRSMQQKPLHVDSASSRKSGCAHARLPEWTVGQFAPFTGRHPMLFFLISRFLSLPPPVVDTSCSPGCWCPSFQRPLWQWRVVFMSRLGVTALDGLAKTKESDKVCCCVLTQGLLFRTLLLFRVVPSCC